MGFCEPLSLPPRVSRGLIHPRMSSFGMQDAGKRREFRLHPQDGCSALRDGGRFNLPGCVLCAAPSAPPAP